MKKVAKTFSWRNLLPIVRFQRWFLLQLLPKPSAFATASTTGFVFGLQLLLRIVVKIFLSCSSDLEVHFRWDTLTLHVSRELVDWTVPLRGSFLLEGQRFQRFQRQESIATTSTASLYASSLAAANSLPFFFQFVKSFSFFDRVFLPSSRAGTSFAFTSWIVVANFLLYLQGQLLSDLLRYFDHINCFTSRVSNQLVFETWINWPEPSPSEGHPLPPSRIQHIDGSLRSRSQRTSAAAPSLTTNSASCYVRVRYEHQHQRPVTSLETTVFQGLYGAILLQVLWQQL